MTAIVAALPREVQTLVAGVKPDTLSVSGIQLHRLPSAVVVSAGMGAARAALAFEAALRAGPVTQVISVGLAGACDPELRAGSVVEPGRIVDVLTGERFDTEDVRGGPLLASAETIASIAEKTRLRNTYNAGLVDMEAATLARLAMAHGLRFRAVKGISDAYDFELASLSQFAGKRGEFRTAAFALHTAWHPTEWRSAMKLGRNSGLALAAVTVRVKELLAAAK